MHTFEPRRFWLFDMSFDYKPLILHTHCMPAIYVQYGHFTRPLPLVILPSHDPHRQRLNFGNWAPVDLFYNDFFG
jgi:hypothetical protein